jgi:CBS domain-containing protein
MALEIPDRMKEAAEQLNNGGPKNVTVRELLSWFGAERRGYWKVREIRKALKHVKLKTEPDFEGVWINAEISLVPRVNAAPTGSEEGGSAVVSQEPSGVSPAEDLELVTGKTAADPTVGLLGSANKSPVTVRPDDSVEKGTTLMLLHDFSQLPVMTSEFIVKGLFSWKSLGRRLALGHKCDCVRECMDTHFEIKSNASLFEAIRLIVEHDCILVRDTGNRISGIVTTADLSEQFAKLGEPFLLLGQVENHIRDLIAGKFTRKELKEARDPGDSDREVEDVADLTLGEYLRLLQEPKRWEKLGIKVDRGRFTNELDGVRQIRNDVMHFDPDGVGDDALATLRRFALFLQRLRQYASDAN